MHEENLLPECDGCFAPLVPPSRVILVLRNDPIGVMDMCEQCFESRRGEAGVRLIDVHENAAEILATLEEASE